MELSLFTIICFYDSDIAPLAKFVVTNVGNISGVKPTAIEIENNKALSQSFLVYQLTKNTIGTITSMNLINK